ncbi:MAG: hypothetical protein ABI863_24195 [Ginsengibacter sp.]
MKKILIVILILIVLITGVYLYIRFSVLRSKDFKPDTSKSKSILDLRPQLIAKLQQLVKDGSGGLYNLSVGEIRPHISSGGVDMITVRMVPDSLALLKLKNSADAPGEVFKMSIDSFHIDGLGIEDLLHENKVDLKTISFTGPVIEMYELKKIPGKKKNDTATLYQKLMKQMKRISINEILVLHGTVINHNFGQKNQTIKLDDIEIKMDSVLIDSSTQFDQKRFLFAEEVQISARNLRTKTEDSLYFLKCGSVKISTSANSITILDISVEPGYSRKEFESKFSTRKYMFTLDIPKLTLQGINWWDIVNGRSVIAKEAVMENGKCEVYLDRSLPFRKIKQNNFPQQILMRTPMPFSVAKMKMHHTKLLYTEYNPGTDQTGNVVVSDVNGTVENITNIGKEIKKNRFMTSASSGSFMNRVPLDVGFHFDLSKYKTGNFTMDLKVGEMDSSILNPITGPLAEFIFKRGSIREGTVHVEGNNFKASGKGMLLYKDLYLVAVKKNKEEPGKIKQRKLLSFIGNVVLIKNSNPSKGKEPRKETFSSERNDHQPFFSLVWKTIYIGVLKSIGLPPGFGNKSY